MKYKPKQPLEAYIRSVIEKKLETLGYNLNEYDKNCNVYRERAKMNYQDNLLNGRNPDFIIYKTATDTPLAVIEAKRKDSDLDKALEHTIKYYADPLDIPVVFVFNETSFYACSNKRKPVKIDNVEISDFVDEQTLTNLIENNFEIHTVPSELNFTREDLLKKFKDANILLRKAGLRDGYERFSTFTDILFLKLKNDFDDYGEVSQKELDIEKFCNWEKLISKTPKRLGNKFEMDKSEVKSYLEDTIKPKLKEKYGDVFENSLNIQDESILIELIELIDDINFLRIDSDVKGDAFEFFLRNVTNGNKDLGEYYTPRHISRMLVRFLAPKVGDKIYDPFCGTGGFLLECYKYLIENSDEEDAQSKDIIRKNTLFGGEITSTARISKMNMILFGDGHSNIEQRNSLQNPIKGEYNIAISNIPYSQKVEEGGLYSYPSKNGDSIFVQHLWDSVKKGGRMAVIVPETFLYEKGALYNCRKYILENCSEITVVSLPRGVFNPYTPTKTSIIIAKKRTKKEENKNIRPISCYMYIIRNDGFELGQKRRPLNNLSDCNKFLMDYSTNKKLRITKEPNSKEVNFSEIENNEYVLLPFAYMEHLPNKDIKNLVKLGDFIEESIHNVKDNFQSDDDEECAILSVTKNGIYINEICTLSELHNKSQKYKRVISGDITYNPHRINIGSIGVVPKLHKNMFVSYIYPVVKVKRDIKISPFYFVKLLKQKKYLTIISDYSIGGARSNLPVDQLLKIKFIMPNPLKLKSYNDLGTRLQEAHAEYLRLLSQLNY